MTQSLLITRKYTKDDYKKISKNFKVINILYCTLSIDQNVVLSEFVTQDEIVMDKNVKQVQDFQYHEEQKYKNDDSFQDLLYDAIECTRIMELFGGEKDKDSRHSSILKHGEYEARSTVDFSDNNLPATYYIFDDLNTTINFQLSEILGYDMKIKKMCQDLEKEKFCLTNSSHF